MTHHSYKDGQALDPLHALLLLPLLCTGSSEMAPKVVRWLEIEKEDSKFELFSLKSVLNVEWLNPEIDASTI